MSILFGFLPKWTARKALAGRAKVTKAIETYYQAGGLDQASCSQS